MDDAYHPISAIVPSHRLFCLSLPFVLGQHPFAQGITSSAEMAEVVGDAIDAAEGTEIQPGPAEIPPPARCVPHGPELLAET
jgi:hypothetical protein